MRVKATLDDLAWVPCPGGGYRIYRVTPGHRQLVRYDWAPTVERVERRLEEIVTEGIDATFAESS